MKVSVSFLKSKDSIENTIKKIDSSIANYIHVDIMDGIFVDNKNFDFSTISYYLTDVKKPLDIHLMVSDVMKYVKEYVLLKPEYITFHIESNTNCKEIIDYLHLNNIKAGIAINPETSVDSISNYLDDIDLVLVMGVKPGMGGQEFIKENIEKIDYLNKINNNRFLVSVDGGVNDQTIKMIKSDMVVSGSYICEQDDYDLAINSLK